MRSGDVTGHVTVGARYSASPLQGQWWRFWHGEIGEWILDKGLRVVLLLVFAVLASRFITMTAQRITGRLEAGFATSDDLIRSEIAKHRRAVASVVSWVLIAVLSVIVAVKISDIIDIPVSSLVGPAAVLGGALGFGAQKVVQDLFSGFFIITERQYGWGDLVRLTLADVPSEAMGTVEELTLRITKIRTADGEVFTIPNGNIVRSLNLSKDWARTVIDIPVPITVDLGKVNAVLRTVSEHAMDPEAPLCGLLLAPPAVMGVESIQREVVNLQMVVRTLPGKQFEVGRRLRMQVVRALRESGVMIPPPAVEADGTPTMPVTGTSE